MYSRPELMKSSSIVQTLPTCKLYTITLLHLFIHPTLLSHNAIKRIDTALTHAGGDSLWTIDDDKHLTA
jgi:hypothetical protein